MGLDGEVVGDHFLAGVVHDLQLVAARLQTQGVYPHVAGVLPDQLVVQFGPALGPGGGHVGGVAGHAGGDSPGGVGAFQPAGLGDEAGALLGAAAGAGAVHEVVLQDGEDLLGSRLALAAVGAVFAALNAGLGAGGVLMGHGGLVGVLAQIRVHSAADGALTVRAPVVRPGGGDGLAALGGSAVGALHNSGSARLAAGGLHPGGFLHGVAVRQHVGLLGLGVAAQRAGEGLHTLGGAGGGGGLHAVAPNVGAAVGDGDGVDGQVAAGTQLAVAPRRRGIFNGIGLGILLGRGNARCAQGNALCLQTGGSRVDHIIGDADLVARVQSDRHLEFAHQSGAAGSALDRAAAPVFGKIQGVASDGAGNIAGNIKGAGRRPRAACRHQFGVRVLGGCAPHTHLSGRPLSGHMGVARVLTHGGLRHGAAHHGHRR